MMMAEMQAESESMPVAEVTAEMVSKAEGKGVGGVIIVRSAPWPGPVIGPGLVRGAGVIDAAVESVPPAEVILFVLGGPLLILFIKVRAVPAGNITAVAPVLEAHPVPHRRIDSHPIVDRVDGSRQRPGRRSRRRSWIRRGRGSIRDAAG